LENAYCIQIMRRSSIQEIIAKRPKQPRNGSSRTILGLPRMFWTPAPGLVGWQHNQRARPSRVVTVHRTQRRLAGREGCSVRKINKTISLAFLAPHLVKAAINGFLRYGLEVARLCDLPAEWFPSAPDVVATTFGPVFTQERSASGKRDSSAQRQTAQNRLQGQKRSPRRPKRSRKSPPIAGFLAVSGKSRGLKECVADLRGL
jgi:hypothetical protein